MSDLISRQAAIEQAVKESQVEGAYGYMDTKSIVDMLNGLPTIEAEPVRHGRWLDGNRGKLDGTLYWYRYCSECLCERDDDNEDKDTPYCPDCGAKMEVDDE